MRAVIFDIDGTLADCRHRQHHVTNGKKDWPSFYSKLGEDTIIAETAQLFDTLQAAGSFIILCSGRPEDYRGATVSWLLDNGLHDWDGLYMRPSGDFRPDHIVKSQLLDGIIADGYEPWLVIDDRPSVVKMWRERGLMCLQVNNSWEEPRTHAKPALLTLMVGPSGSGKSTFLSNWPNTLLTKWGIEPSHIISSDAMRKDICGDFKDQSQNDLVWATVHGVIKARLQGGAPTVLDATNIKRADRLKAVALANGGPVRYLVIDRPLHEKRRDGGWRNEIPGLDLIGKHDQIFRSQLKDILAGDDQPNVTVVDLRMLIDD